jgi:hypothetical protein
VTELVMLVAKFGLPTVLAAAIIYVVIRGDLQFRYPRQSQRRKKVKSRSLKQAGLK